jgi:BMFP domain-containing protein YqiC
MIDSKQISSLVEAVASVIPEQLGAFPENAQNNLKATLASVFAKMDLVTREEFDVQTNVLAKTRKKLEELEKQIGNLEAK